MVEKKGDRQLPLLHLGPIVIIFQLYSVLFPGPYLMHYNNTIIGISWVLTVYIYSLVIIYDDTVPIHCQVKMVLFMTAAKYKVSIIFIPIG